MSWFQVDVDFEHLPCREPVVGGNGGLVIINPCTRLNGTTLFFVTQ